jgi:RNA polymerase sigma factor (sigma-70 family)
VSQNRETLRVIHDRVIAGDPTGPSELFVVTHRPIARVIHGRFQSAGLSWDDAADLATDAIVSYLSAPDRFDPQRTSLLTYLVMIARGDAMNLIRDRGAQRKNYIRLVELNAPDGNIADASADRRLDAESLLRAHIDEIAETDMDRRVLELMLRDERETAVYAAALGIEHLSLPQQRRTVKRAKDKIEKGLRRLGKRLDA